MSQGPVLPRIYISCVSDEFRTIRRRVEETVRHLGYEPVTMEYWATGHGEVLSWLRRQIDSCDGLIQITGIAFGVELPDVAPLAHGLPGAPPRYSYSQFEFHYAAAQRKKTWLILPGPGCTRDTPADLLDLPRNPATGLPDANLPGASDHQEELRNLQANYIHFVKNSNRIFHSPADDKELTKILLNILDYEVAVGSDFGHGENMFEWDIEDTQGKSIEPSSEASPLAASDPPAVQLPSSGETRVGFDFVLSLPWDDACTEVLTLLEALHQTAYRQKQGQPFSDSGFWSEITPRGVWLAALIHASQLSDFGTERHGMECFFDVRDISQRTTVDLRQLLHWEFHRGDVPDNEDESGAVFASEGLLNVARQANELRTKTGTFPRIGTRHLLASLLIPSRPPLEPGATVIDERDRVRPWDVFQVLCRCIKSDKSAKRYEMAHEWTEIIILIRDGFGDNVPDDANTIDLPDWDNPFDLFVEAKERKLSNEEWIELQAFLNRGDLALGSTMTDVVWNACFRVAARSGEDFSLEVEPFDFFVALVHLGLKAADSDRMQPPKEIVLRLRIGEVEINWAEYEYWKRRARGRAGEPLRLSQAAKECILQMKSLAVATGMGRVASRHGVAIQMAWLRMSPVLLEILERQGIEIGRLGAVLAEHISSHEKLDTPKVWPRELKRLGLSDLVKLSGPEADAWRQKRKSEMNREAGDLETCLNADEYSTAIAQLFAGAGREEFCLAVYGRWGRGKTFLMNKVAGRLPGHYRSITFKAWKYPSTPEVWVHLYETFASRAWENDKGQLRGYPLRVGNVLRTGIARVGIAPLIIAWAALAFALVPLGPKVNLLWTLLQSVSAGAGVLTFVVAMGFAVRVKNTASKLHQTYMRGVRHDEKLGLQGTIGKDLKLLVKGWIRPPSQRGKSQYWVLLWLLLPMSLWAGGLVRFYGNEGGVAVIHMIGILTTLLGIVLIGSYFAAPQRVLLTVDDLDRCPPAHLLQVMESIKLLVEDDEIKERVQLAMLVEEEILKHAIYDKYKSLLDPKAKRVLKTTYNGSRLIRENCDKLFTTHLRLGDLTKEEARSLLEYIGRKERKMPASDLTTGSLERASGEKTPAARSGDPVALDIAGSRRGDLDSPPGNPANPASSHSPLPPAGTKGEQPETRGLIEVPLGRQPEALGLPPSESSKSGLTPDRIEQQNQPPSATEADRAAIDDDDRRAIDFAIFSAAESFDSDLSPRTLRAFFFRYQLARLLFHQLEPHKEIDPRQLAMLLVDRSSQAPGRLDGEDLKKLKVIVSQVT